MVSVRSIKQCKVEKIKMRCGADLIQSCKENRRFCCGLCRTACKVGGKRLRKERTVKKKNAFKRELPLHLMLLPGVIFTFIFCYIPMAGMVIAFQKFIPAKGMFGDQEWVGFDNFIYLINMPGAMSALKNTIVIAFFKIILGLIVPITVAIMLNEVRSNKFRRTVQTAIYLPYFLSWVVLGGVMIDILSPSSGIVNEALGLLGIEPVFFLGSNKWFQPTIVVTDIWKGFGFGTVVYLAAITGIDPSLYEAATMDGANRFQKMWHVTLPGIRMIVVLMCVLSLGNVLNAGFDQILNLYSPQVYETGDIIDTFIYRIGLIDEITHPVLRNAAAVRSRIGLDGHIILGFCFRSRNGDKINLDIRIFFFKFLNEVIKHLRSGLAGVLIPESDLHHFSRIAPCVLRSCFCGNVSLTCLNGRTAVRGSPVIRTAAGCQRRHCHDHGDEDSCFFL